MSAARVARNPRLGVLVGAAALVAAGLVVAAVARLSAGDLASNRSPPATRMSELELAARELLPAAPAPAIVVPRPALLADARHTARWAAVVAPVQARAAPRSQAPAVAQLDTHTPEETVNIVSVVGSTRDGAGRIWVKARIPGLPGKTTGWIPREALGGYHVVHTRLVVDIERLTATLYSAGRPVFRARVGVGQAVSPTPKGEFYVRDKLRTLDTSFYGPLAFGTSARSAVLTDWPGGGFVGIHGTSEPDLLPGRVSHGCIRLRNSDILELGRLMPVGTPLSIV